MPTYKIASSILKPIATDVAKFGPGQSRPCSHLRAALVSAVLLAFIQSSPAMAAAVAPPLGTAGTYTVLGANAIPTSGTVTCTNTGPGSTINGNVGSTFTSITNTLCSIIGTVDASVAGAVVTDFNNAYNALDSQNPVCDGVIPTTSTALPPGIYCSAAGTTIGAGVTFTLDGSASDVWVFKIGTGGGGDLTGTGFSVVMGGSALACNVYWHTADAATMTDSDFIGTVLAGTDVTMTRGSWEGRALATGDATVTDAASMTFAGCSAPSPITVNKNFTPDSIATVPVALTCTSGTVSTTPLNAAEGAPAVFTVGGADLTGTTCTATETVPVGYTANQANCVDVALGGSCTITNTLNSDTIVVNKDFIPNSIGAVPVALTCTSGTVQSSPLNASESTPAVFTVTGASQGATCTATETVPAGYTANQANCVDVALGGSCTITNTLNSDTIVVNKDFSPNSIATVPVALTCTSGTAVTTPLDASESTPAVFTVTGASPGATCTATETVPAGYTANQANCAGVTLGGSCTITNTLNSDTIVVNKDFSPNSIATVPVALSCTSGTAQTTPLDASEAIPAVFTVTGASPGATCTATETVPAGYTADQADCVGVTLGGSCTITNTVNSDTIVVNKDFSPNSAALVSVALNCTTGTPDATPLNASESAPAVFTVTGADPNATCTATETVPDGYTANQSDCMDVELGGSCTISNTLTSNMITVHKDFSPNSIATVPVALTCTSGTPEATPLNASESTPAVFTVNGADPDATCTATETVPTGYTADQANCVDVALGGSCTITNTLDNNTIVVNKDFIPNSIATVPVVLTCTSGAADTTPLNASESTPAVFTVNGADPDATCTATETVPAGYTADQANCLDVPLGGSCEIANTLNTDTIRVSKVYTDGSTTAVDVTINCQSGNVDNTGNTFNTKPLAGGGFTSFTVTGFNQTIDASGQDTQCTITESNVPANYFQLDATNCTQIMEHQDNAGLCTFTNAPTRATFEVYKHFDDGNPAEVIVHIDCTTGLIPDQDQNVSEGHPIEFVVTEFDNGEMDCEITEIVPVGYDGEYYDGSSYGNSCEYLAITGGPDGGLAFQCDIYNALIPIDFDVQKVWFDEHPEFENSLMVRGKYECLNEANVQCDFGSTNDCDMSFGYYNSLWWSGLDSYDHFDVYPHWNGTTLCTVYEKIRDSSVESDASDCEGVKVLLGQDIDAEADEGYECTIYNTRIYEGIPALSQYGLALLALLMLGVGFVSFRRFI